MMHFEILWEQAEGLQKDNKIVVEECITRIQDHLKSLQTDDSLMHEYHIGLVIYNLCNISRILNINAYTSLQKAVTDAQSEFLERKV